MQNEVDGPANTGYVQLFKVLFNLFTSCLHKLLFIPLSPFLVISLPGRSPAALTKRKTEGVDNQPRSDENVPLYILLQNEFTFQVDDKITSSATRVMFNNSDRTRRQICLKMWRECQNKVYNIGNFSQQTTFLLEGLAFNRRLSGDVYYGIVPVLSDRSGKLECSPLIPDPILANLAPNRPYALVMKRLKKGWRLDRQLRPMKLGNKRGMEFLAHQVVAMHQKLDCSSQDYGTPELIARKCEFNIEEFHRALDRRKTNPQIMAEAIFSETDMKSIESTPDLLRRLSEAYWDDFKKRYSTGHIKRCHGDLKASNLWICPPESGSQARKRLVALDCVDFNPEFCNIDTLSDIAMLAIDLEMRLENPKKSRRPKLSAQQLARQFLQTYLKAVGENDTVWPILEYYMTEKAMVCAYMSIVYDELPTLGERYLKVVLAHSQELARCCPLPYRHNGYEIAASYDQLNHSECLSV